MSSRAWPEGAPARLSSEASASTAQLKPEFPYFALDLANASLQSPLRSAACDLMQAPIAPGLTSAQSFFSSALQALPIDAVRMIAT